MRNVFDAGRYITWASERGVGPGNLKYFGPKMALAYRLDAISHFTPLPLAHVMYLHASKTLRTGPYKS